MTRFSCDLDLPRDETKTGLPRDWLVDNEISHSGRGLLLVLATELAPGVILTDADLEEQRHPEDDPLNTTVNELAEAGYLQPVDDDAGGEAHYQLVHPDRFAPLPGREADQP